jgi:hypothetical protein
MIEKHLSPIPAQKPTSPTIAKPSVDNRHTSNHHPVPRITNSHALQKHELPEEGTYTHLSSFFPVSLSPSLSSPITPNLKNLLHPLLSRAANTGKIRKFLTSRAIVRGKTICCRWKKRRYVRLRSRGRMTDAFFSLSRSFAKKGVCMLLNSRPGTQCQTVKTGNSDV